MDRDKALEMALGQIEKQFGKGSIMKLGERGNVGVEAIPTGALALDLALGIGGLPRGRIVEIFGPESSGKSTLAMHVVAEAQRNGGVCAYIDAEHAMDPVYANAIGVNVDELLISQPDTGEQALEIADMLIRSGALDVLVIDSVAALVPRAEIEGEMGDSHMGLQARLMSQALRKLTGNLNKSRTIAVFINQLREKIGIVFGNPETTPGGRALKFYASVRLDIRRVESIKDGAEVVGNRTRVKVVKNKCAAAGTMVFDPTTGLTHPIEDVVHNYAGSAVVAADKAGHLHVRRIVTRMDQGEQDVIGLRLRDGTELWVTPDHRVLTDDGWREAGALATGDVVARPRVVGSFGDREPMSPDHARLLGYLVGDGYVGGKTPIAFINVQESLQEDAVAIAATLGCKARHRGIETSFSHRIGERNGVLELARAAGIWGKLAPEKLLPPEFFTPDISRAVVANVLFGLLETDGYVTAEHTGALRCGFVSTSEQLAHQIHWLLLRFGIWSSVRGYDPTTKRPSLINGRQVRGTRRCFEVRISGIDNVARFADAIPTWGPRGTVLRKEVDRVDRAAHRGSQSNYLPATVTEPVLGYLRAHGVTAQFAAQLLARDDGRGGMRQVLGPSRLRRDRVAQLADALDSGFLREVLAEELHYARIEEVLPAQRKATYDIEVEELHNFVADGVVVHNCAPPFRQAEFDIMYGKGISREGSLLDVGVDLGIVKKSGAWFTYEGEQLGQGRENVKSFLAENVDLMVEISEKIKVASGINDVEIVLDEVEGAEDADAEL
ncbi:MAG: intein-containing recombinase RecA [Acidimicrobiia bacterium]